MEEKPPAPQRPRGELDARSGPKARCARRPAEGASRLLGKEHLALELEVAAGGGGGRGAGLGVPALLPDLPAPFSPYRHKRRNQSSRGLESLLFNL